jgi:hypothetical protein
MPDAARDKGLDWFGGKNTQRGILLFMVRHAAEHRSSPLVGRYQKEIDSQDQSRTIGAPPN